MFYITLKNFFYLFLPILWLLVWQTANSQDMASASKNINTLCSKKFFGRGYVKKGDLKAAEFIAQQFEKAGAKPWDKKTWFQTFTMDINTFPGAMILKINDKKLTPGIDFVPKAYCGSGTFKKALPYYIDSADINNPEALYNLTQADLSNAVIVFDAGLSNEIMTQARTYIPIFEKARAIIELAPSLMITLTYQQFKTPWLVVKKSSWPQKINSVAAKVTAKQLPKHTPKNVIATIKGTKTPDSLLVFTAHYDHVGGIGAKTYVPGANDNASGTAMLITLAQMLANNPPDYSVVLIAFAGEEAGLLGSKHFTQNPWFDLNKIKMLINLDLVGTGQGIMVENGPGHPFFIDRLRQYNTHCNSCLGNVKLRGNAANSDHYFFTTKNVPALYIYTTEPGPGYHHISDHPSGLNLKLFPSICRFLVSYTLQRDH